LKAWTVWQWCGWITLVKGELVVWLTKRKLVLKQLRMSECIHQQQCHVHGAVAVMV
jgi:hypothetical protein